MYYAEYMRPFFFSFNRDEEYNKMQASIVNYKINM